MGNRYLIAGVVAVILIIVFFIIGPRPMGPKEAVAIVEKEAAVKAFVEKHPAYRSVAQKISPEDAKSFLGDHFDVYALEKRDYYEIEFFDGGESITAIVDPLEKRVVAYG